MRSFKHWTLRYIVDRLAVMRYEHNHPDAPWLTRSMVEILVEWLHPDDTGLEFGSGRSTVWFAKRVAHLTSVEHDPGWYSTVTERLRQAGITDRVDYRLCEDGSTERETLEYVAVAKQIAPGILDFCLVDGMARDHCALAILEKIKPGGALIIDNINWYLPRESKTPVPKSRGIEDGYASEQWEKFAQAVKDWRCIWTTSGITDTALWVKPVLWV